MKHDQTSRIFDELRTSATPANLLTPEIYGKVIQLPMQMRERLALETKTVAVYHGDEITAVGQAEERGALAAIPNGFKIEDLNGLNIGCGSRLVSPYLTPVDVTRSPLLAADGTPFPNSTSAGALLADLFDLPFKEESVDYIVSLHTVEHIHDPIQLIRHWLSVIRPGGGIGLILPDWRYTWSSENDHAAAGHRWNPTPRLVENIWRSELKDLCALERLDTYPYKVSFDVVLRKPGVFAAKSAGVAGIPSGADLASRKAAAHQIYGTGETDPMEKDSSLREELNRVTEQRDRYYRWANGYIDFGPKPVSNVENWKVLQEEGYFENHPNHRGLVAFHSNEIPTIERFRKLKRTDKVVVVGCGYGRDVAQIAPHVQHVYGIDVNKTILDKATTFLVGEGISNFTPVLVDDYPFAIPRDIDLAFCFVVTQHLTRDLTRNYIQTLGSKLSPDGVLLFQFLETMVEGETLADAKLENYEPSVSWTVTQLHRLGSLCDVETIEINTIPVAGGAALWHWACWGRKQA